MSTPAHPPALPTTKSLPVEIIASILSYLRFETDRTTLARCMRVSSTFKALVRPSLYIKLEWTDWEEERWPVATESKDSRGRTVRVESDDKDLRLIKTIEIRQHALDDCPRSFGKAYGRRRMVLDILRIMTLQPDLLIHMLGSGQATCLHRASCPLMAELSPRKILVLTDGQIPNASLHFGRFDTSHLESYVVHLSLVRSREWSMPRLPINCQSKRLVIVLIPPEHYTVDPDYAYDTTLFLMIGQIMHHCRPSHHVPQIVSEVVLVNFNILTDYKPIGPFGSLKRMWEMLLHANHADGAVIPRVGPVVLTSTTMSEYLSDHNWDGEFSEEEAARLLAQEADMKRAAEGVAAGALVE
jgi:hypothetical protein